MHPVAGSKRPSSAVTMKQYRGKFASCSCSTQAPWRSPCLPKPGLRVTNASQLTHHYGDADVVAVGAPTEVEPSPDSTVPSLTADTTNRNTANKMRRTTPITP